MDALIQKAANENPGSLGDALLAIDRLVGLLQAQAAQGLDIFGLGGLGNVVLGPGAYPGFSGLLDYESITTENGAICTPAPGEFTFVRARKKIIWGGTYNGDGVFTDFPNLISFGSPTQSGGGGGGGGGDSTTGTGSFGQNANGFGGGQGVGYTSDPPYAIGVQGQGGSPGNNGTDGTAGSPGPVDNFFLQSSLAIFPGIQGAFGGVIPGLPGAQGAQGGQGASGPGPGGGGNPGNGGTPGNGGKGGGLLILAAPSIEFLPGHSISLQGTDGTGATAGTAGQDAPPASGAGGGGGGGGGSGGQGGGAGVCVYYFGSTSGAPSVILVAGVGGAGAPGGDGGAGDGTGSAGGDGGGGAAGPDGAPGFVFGKQVVLA